MLSTSTGLRPGIVSRIKLSNFAISERRGSSSLQINSAGDCIIAAIRPLGFTSRRLQRLQPIEIADLKLKLLLCCSDDHEKRNLPVLRLNPGRPVDIKE